MYTTGVYEIIYTIFMEVGGEQFINTVIDNFKVVIISKERTMKYDVCQMMRDIECSLWWMTTDGFTDILIKGDTIM